MARRQKKASHPKARPAVHLAIDPALVIDPLTLANAAPVVIAEHLARAHATYSYLAAHVAHATSRVSELEHEYRVALATAHEDLRAQGVPREDIRHREVLDPRVQKVHAELQGAQRLKRDAEAKVSTADQMMKVLSRMLTAAAVELEKLPTTPTNYRPIRP